MRTSININDSVNDAGDVTRRRAFLKNIAGIGVAGAAFGVDGAIAADAAETTAAADTTGYRETDHIRAYYRLARF